MLPLLTLFGKIYSFYCFCVVKEKLTTTPRLGLKVFSDFIGHSYNVKFTLCNVAARFCE